MHPLMAEPQLAPIAALVRDVAIMEGFDLVRVCFGAGGRATLQIMAERPDGSNGTIEAYAGLSRAISALLDERDAVPGDAYQLEVSSPGIDRPLTRPEDFERWKGFEVRVETGDPIAGRTRFHGDIIGLADGMVLLQESGGKVEVPFAELRRAKLVLNDKLLAATRRAA